MVGKGAMVGKGVRGVKEARAEGARGSEGVTMNFVKSSPCAWGC